MTMLIMTDQGLYCPAGNFFIDPSRAVENAVITHAHSDHARRGSRKYFTVDKGVSLLKARIGQNITVQSFKYGEAFFINQVKISFHSAGHILGSSQVRLEHEGLVWVASGDYKREPDPTCAPFEIVKCDVFVTEATFGAPSFKWPKEKNLGAEIYEWWCANAELGMNSVLFAYSLGKAQRVLGVLHPYASRPVYCHPSVTTLNECYRDEGVALADTFCLSQLHPQKKLQGELFLVPQSFLKTDQARVIGDHYQTAFASGWMAPGSSGYGRGNFDHGFVMSDHADWNDLVQTVQETGAKKIYVQHRGKGALVRHLKNLGLQAFPDSDLFPKNPSQLMLF
ncbi:MAG: ligase-associated DNA damage response exonuclease [Bdellovibrionaceae bacterium]|nr:ligase-associated DNA damage response exonuclease [Bdellovibrio sp.]